MAANRSVYLVVDDFEVMRKVIVGHLRLLGAYKIWTATNGVEALHILRREQIHLVLSDLNMPVMSGLELLKAVRADERLCTTPFIVITAEYDRPLIKAVIDAGVSDLLVKPFTQQRLSTCVEQVCAWQHRKTSKFSTPPLLKSDSASHLAERVSSHKALALPSDLRPSLLIVDDANDNQLVLSDLFNDEYLVRLANDGPTALTICRSDTPPDLVLLDVMMPDMDGFEVARLMREHPVSENIPIIFVTAMTDSSARWKGMSLGAIDFVSKPIDLSMLQLRVSNFMRYVALHKNLQTECDNMLALARLRDDVDHITRHDMRGPLAGALGLVQLLANNGTLTPTQSTQLSLLEETVLQVLNMINLSSEIFKIETGRFQLNAQPVMIEDIVQCIVKMTSNTFVSKKLMLHIDAPVGKAPVQALGDALFCYSLLQNLVKNACEAAPVQSQVDIVLSDTDPLRIMIKNSGTVPADVRNNFFDKFTTRNKTNGNGLGTYSAKLLVEAQGGQIEMEVSDDDNTTSLWITLPRAPG
jgi:CheY-like chemotaxis protein